MIQPVYINLSLMRGEALLTRDNALASWIVGDELAQVMASHG